MDETHNHGVDPTTFQLTPRQQVYRLCRMKKRKRLAEDDDEEDENLWGDSRTAKKNKSGIYVLIFITMYTNNYKDNQNFSFQLPTSQK